MIALRKNDVALRDGKYISLNGSDPKVMSYLRQYGEDVVLVVLNMSKTEQQEAFDLSAEGLGSVTAHMMLATTGSSANEGALKTITLAPYGVYIAKLTK